MIFLHVSGPWTKLPEMAQMGPEGFFRTNPDLANILGGTDFDFKNFYSLDLLDSKFPDFQVPRNLAWARLGPGWALLLLQYNPLSWPMV